HVLAEAQVLVVELERMPEPVALRLQVTEVLGVRGDLDRLLADDAEPEALEADDLLRVVREDADRRQAEVGEDLRPDAVLARVDRIAELDVRVDRVAPLLLEPVFAPLREEPDASALLAQ